MCGIMIEFWIITPLSTVGVHNKALDIVLALTSALFIACFSRDVYSSTEQGADSHGSLRAGLFCGLFISKGFQTHYDLHLPPQHTSVGDKCIFLLGTRRAWLQLLYQDVALPERLPWVPWYEYTYVQVVGSGDNWFRVQNKKTIYKSWGTLKKRKGTFLEPKSLLTQLLIGENGDMNDWTVRTIILCETVLVGARNDACQQSPKGE